MRNVLIALLSGTLFGAGLAVSGMVDPARIRGFLDVFGHWDPTLAFVMGGAVGVMAVAWMLESKMQKPIYAEAFVLPSTRLVDFRLIAGAAIFGIGWGLSGLCPGPAIADFAIKPRSALIFVAPMLLGMAIQRLDSWRAAHRLLPTNARTT
ncbi:YeeE/YedE family protein [Lichenicola cladoniae]|uniref:YeeE/YedE family protein n=1 Tax=Lichenicola cladoniae TaxID=1484109 RepID=A0A6M8HVM4_9PROT|nr:YeeE/YedE family protein [Acetobacteraceae bacterium]QKE92422.1 YeeE/YedE family protein [Lichenicola cladoniae]